VIPAHPDQWRPPSVCSPQRRALARANDATLRAFASVLITGRANIQAEPARCTGRATVTPAGADDGTGLSPTGPRSGAPRRL
jgi:hypothetical protein